ncbi:hypothetical protein N579_06160 [Corynebacterium pseudodiphtheriticum 090104]|nr:hypothetical protein N579_06160 [Corynebacterium pseudodiphtheriticum 090104]
MFRGVGIRGGEASKSGRGAVNIVPDDGADQLVFRVEGVVHRTMRHPGFLSDGARRQAEGPIAGHDGVCDGGEFAAALLGGYTFAGLLGARVGAIAGTSVGFGVRVCAAHRGEISCGWWTDSSMRREYSRMPHQPAAAAPRAMSAPAPVATFMPVR